MERINQLRSHLQSPNGDTATLTPREFLEIPGPIEESDVRDMRRAMLKTTETGNPLMAMHLGLQLPLWDEPL